MWSRNMPDTNLKREQAEHAIERALAGLPERERYVLSQRFGFYGPTCTLKKIAERLGVTPGAVQLMEARGLRRLKKPRQIRLLHAAIDDDVYSLHVKPLHLTYAADQQRADEQRRADWLAAHRARADMSSFMRGYAESELRLRGEYIDPNISWLIGWAKGQVSLQRLGIRSIKRRLAYERSEA